MAKIIEIEINGEKQRITKSQLFKMAANGNIKQDTYLYLDGERKKAKQIEGIQFPPQFVDKGINDDVKSSVEQTSLPPQIVLPPPLPKPIFPLPPDDFDERRNKEKSKALERYAAQRGIFSWLLDFSFNDIRLPVIILWICRIFYTISFVLSLMFATGVTFGLLGGVGFLQACIIIPCVWLGTILWVIYTRICYEFVILAIDWITDTTKAARLYIEREGQN